MYVIDSTTKMKLYKVLENPTNQLYIGCFTAMFIEEQHG